MMSKRFPSRSLFGPLKQLNIALHQLTYERVRLYVAGLNVHRDVHASSLIPCYPNYSSLRDSFIKGARAYPGIQVPLPHDEN